jgi:predicted metalloprotease
VAHEVGHHVQNLFGETTRVHQLQQRVDPAEANQLSVRLELQADCYAGLWTHAAQQQGFIEPGDIEEALAAASAIGDDTLQRSAGRAVVPDSFTHGSAEQRQRWFRRGFDTGTLEACDTFEAADL